MTGRERKIKTEKTLLSLGLIQRRQLRFFLALIIVFLFKYVVELTHRKTVVIETCLFKTKPLEIVFIFSGEQVTAFLSRNKSIWITDIRLFPLLRKREVFGALGTY